MPSSITWIDHDGAARERSLSILALFTQRDSRDELGLGGVRDAFADLLFPGTSTIQTRLRYMLFVPWIYRRLEQERVPAREFARRARALELSLVKPLLTGDDAGGVFGRTAGGTLKRLPSSVYWAGLGAWGIRVADVSQSEYHAGVDALYRRRDLASARRHAHHQDDVPEREPDIAGAIWHDRIPDPPPEFPSAVDFALRPVEAEFLVDRVATAQKGSLLSHLVLHSKPAAVDYPWMHPELASFRPEHRELLDHASRFSLVMHGAAIVYNLALAELDHRDALAEEHRGTLRAWRSDPELDAAVRWSLPRLWEITLHAGHVISPATRRFVESWVGLVCEDGMDVLRSPRAVELVRRREQQLKGGHSRFLNARAREQWRGYAGLGRLSFRWATACAFIDDLERARKVTPHA